VFQNRSGLYGEISCICRELNHDSSYEYIYVCNTRQTYDVFSCCEQGKVQIYVHHQMAVKVFETVLTSDGKICPLCEYFDVTHIRGAKDTKVKRVKRKRENVRDEATKQSIRY